MFKIGDRVRVKSRDERRVMNDIAGGSSPGYTNKMKKFDGKIVTIRNMSEARYQDMNSYGIEELHAVVWRDDWLEPAEPEFELGEELFLI